MPMTFHLVVGGFTQTRGGGNGQVRLFRSLSRQNRDKHLVDYVTWRQDWADWLDFAEFYANGRPIILRAYAYSWGAARCIAGDIWRPSLAAECARRNLFIHSLALCDPVYYSPLILQRWLALLPHAWSRPMTLPPNVRTAYVLRQTSSLPQAARLKNPHKIPLQIDTIPHSTHALLPDTVAWQIQCLNIATEDPS